MKEKTQTKDWTFPWLFWPFFWLGVAGCVVTTLLVAWRAYIVLEPVFVWLVRD